MNSEGVMRATIYTVAERAGVSIATVSRVLNDSPRVKQETRARVLRAVRELGYQPSSPARSLALKSTGTIALLFPEIAGPFFGELIRGIETQARRCRYHLLIYGMHREALDNPLLPFLATKVDGMILGGHCDDACVLGLRERGVPCVLLGRRMEGVTADSIQTDSYEGAYEAVVHLIQHGYRRIAFIGGPETSAHSRARLRAYRRALADHGRPADARWVVSADYSEPGGQRAMEALLALSPPPRAVFAANDQMAIGAFDAARGRGLTIPDDVAIVGFDDIPVAAYVHPALTTVRQNIGEWGERAVQLLVRRIEDPAARVENVMLPTRLVVRQSCGCETRSPPKRLP